MPVATGPLGGWLRSLLPFVVVLLGYFTGIAQTTVTYTSSGTFRVPAGVTSLTVEAWGGGGAGGAANSNNSAGGGGAGGAYARKQVAVTPGTSYTITVGAASSGNGNPSWFGSTTTVFAQGGQQALTVTSNNSNGAGAAGSAALSIGDVVYAGGNGSGGSYTTPFSGAGGGGAGSLGPGTAATGATGGSATNINGGNGANGVTVSADGMAGSNYGGGGSGGLRLAGQDRAGGFGAQGLVTLTYDCPSYNVLTSTTASSICTGSSSAITLNGLPNGSYTVTYNLSGANTASNATATNVTSSGGVASFSTAVLTGIGTTNVQIVSVSSGSPTGCSSTITQNHTASFTVAALVTAPTLATTLPAASSVCFGQGVSATFNSGAGGVSCTDDFTITVNGVTSPYTPGTLAGTNANAGSTITIQGRRANCTLGTCAGTNYITLASWTVSALPVVSPPGSLCAGGTVALSPNSGGTWVSNNTAVATINATSGLVTAVAAGTATFTYTHALTGCSNTTTPLTVHALPATPPTPLSNSPQCASTGVTVSMPGSAPDGETWYWQTTADGTATTNSATSFPTTTSGTYYLRARNNTTFCWSPTSSILTVTVHPVPTITHQPAAADVCFAPLGTTSTLVYTNVTNTPNRYSITWTGPASGLFAPITDASLPVSPISIMVPGSAPAGNYTGLISVKTASGCESTPSPFTLRVKPVPTVAASTTAQTVCSGSTIAPINFTSPIAGTSFAWERDNPSGIIGSGSFAVFSGTAASLTGNFTSSLSATGQVNISVTPSYDGCTGEKVTNIAAIRVNPVPTLAISANATQTVCPGNPTQAVSFSGNATAFNWSAPNLTAIGGPANSGSGNLAPFTAVNSSTAPVSSTVTVTPVYTDVATCAGTAQSFTITVNPIPVLSSSLTPADVCSGSNFSYMPSTSASGVTTSFSWSRAAVPGISNPAASGSGNPNEVLVNTTTANIPVDYVYTLSATNNAVTCSNPSTYAVRVLVKPTPDIAVDPAAVQSVCTGSAMTSAIALSNPNNLAGTSFSWTRSNTASISGTSSGSGASIPALVLTNNTTSVQTTVFTATASLNGCSSSATVPVQVNPPISNNILKYEHIIEVNICGISKQVTINTPPPSGGDGSYTYQWLFSSPGSDDFIEIPASEGGTNQTLVHLISANAFYRRVVKSGGCTHVSDFINVNPPTSSTNQYIYSDQASYCAGGSGASIQLSATVLGAVYTLELRTAANTWTPVSNPAPITGTGNPMSFTGITTPGTYRVTGVNGGSQGCSVVLSGFVTISIDALPAAPSVNSPNPICAGATANLVANTGSNQVTANWYTVASGGTPINGGPLANNTSFVVSPAATTTYYAETVSNKGCPSATRQPVTVTVQPLPVMTSAATAFVCTGSALSLNLTSDITATYTWQAADNPSVTGESTSSQTTGVIGNTLSHTTATNQLVNYTVTPSSNGCPGTPQTVVVTVGPRPVIAPFTTPAVCSGNAFNAVPAGTNLVPANTTYTWTTPGGSGFTGGTAENAPQTAISQTLTNTTAVQVNAVYTVTPATAGCSGNAFTVTVPVNPRPLIAGPQSLTVCSGTSFNFMPANGGGNLVPAGTLYSWAPPTGSNITGIAAGSAQTAVAGQLTNTTVPPVPAVAAYTVTANAAGCTSTFDLNVTVNGGLKASLSGNIIKCAGTAVLLPVTITGTGSFTGTLSDGTAFSGNATSSPTTVMVAVSPLSTTNYTVASLTHTGTGCNSVLATDITGFATVTVPNGIPGIWTGVVSTDWFDCRNWANGMVPDNNTNVEIAAGALRDCAIDPNSPLAPTDKIARSRNITLNRTLTFVNGGFLYVAGNWQNNVGASFAAGTGEVRFMGTAQQTINTTAVAETFYQLTIANTSGVLSEVVLLKPANVKGAFKLVKGRLLTTATYLLTILNGDAFGVDAAGAGNDTYVNGPMRWETTGIGSDFVFPVGKPNAPYRPYRPAIIRTQGMPPPAVNPPVTSYVAEYMAAPGPGLNNRTFLGILNTEHWQIDRPAGAAPAVVGLEYIKPPLNSHWTPLEPCYNCNVAIAKQYAEYGNTWYFTNGQNVNGGFSSSIPEVRWWGDNSGMLWSKLLTSFSPFTFGFDYPIVLGGTTLPVKLLTFDARLQGSDALLQWTVDALTDLDHIDLEYSRDGRSFNQLAAFRPAGSISFNYRHNGLVPGAHYYRLVLTDRQGARITSPTRLLQAAGARTFIHDLPITAVKNRLLVEVDAAAAQGVAYRILQVNGVAVRGETGRLEPGRNRRELQLGDLPQGIYFLQVQTQDGTRRALKFIRE